jgi:hypothetical protein
VKPPSHDPEAILTLQDLSEFPESASIPLASKGGNGPFYPYPNQSSFSLGEWYWNDGVQKSQESFKELLSVISHPKFSLDDIRRTKWSDINTALGANNFDHHENEWSDEDAGWERTQISITIPFHHRMKNPGAQSHVIFELYHRSLVSVIREKLADRTDDEHFHYEPYDLLWKPHAESDQVRVHGELYTSSAFQNAHSQLQEHPGEPGCKLPRVITALMFWSDGTHLTSFGNAKLWPCYLFFGNESKYRRCKPSNNLCNHVAYFQTVRSCLLLLIYW